MKQRYHEHIYSKLLDNIRDAIISGELSQGEKLIESELMDKYKVSRYVLRDVLKKLALEEYVEITKNRGGKVKKMSMQEIEEIYDVLILLESKAAALAALGRNDEEINKLCGMLASMHEKEEKNDFKGWYEENDKLHLFISELCRQNVLTKLIADLRKRKYRQRFLPSMVNHLEEYSEKHEKIIECIFKKEAEQAQRLMALHLETAKNIQINFLRNFSILDDKKSHQPFSNISKEKETGGRNYEWGKTADACSEKRFDGKSQDTFIR